MPGVAREKKSYIFVLCYLQGTHGFPQKIWAKSFIIKIYTCWNFDYKIRIILLARGMFTIVV